MMYYLSEDITGAGSIIGLATGELRDAIPDVDGRVSITPCRFGDTLMHALILRNQNVKFYSSGIWPGFAVQKW